MARGPNRTPSGSRPSPASICLTAPSSSGGDRSVRHAAAALTNDGWSTSSRGAVS